MAKIKEEEDEDENEMDKEEFKWHNQNTMVKCEWDHHQPMVNKSEMKIRSQEMSNIFLVFFWN